MLHDHDPPVQPVGSKHLLSARPIDPIHSAAINNTVVIPRLCIVDRFRRGSYLSIRNTERGFQRSDSHAAIQPKDAGWCSSVAFLFMWFSHYTGTMEAYAPAQTILSYNTGEARPYPGPFAVRAALEQPNTAAGRLPTRHHDQDHLFAFA